MPWGDGKAVAHAVMTERVPGDFMDFLEELYRFEPQPLDEELTLNVWEASISGFGSEHRELRKAIRKAMEQGVTTSLVVHSRRGAAIVPLPPEGEDQK